MAALVTAALVAALPGASAATAAPSSGGFADPGRSSIQVVGLEVDGMTDPIGTEATAPSLSWRLDSRRNGSAQTSYQIEVASSEAALHDGRADLWDTGRVRSTEQTVTYDGEQLGSRQQVWWRARVWDERDRVSRWSEDARWELGLLEDEDWAAEWVKHPAFGESRPVTLDFDDTTARYVRLEASRLGLPLQESFGRDAWRLQLAEVQVIDSSDPGTVLSAGQPVTAYRALEVSGVWEPQFLTDGDVTTDSDPRGYSSEHTFDPDVSTDPMWVEIDLGQKRTFDRVVLYPRTDTLTPDGRTPNFPRDFRLRAGQQPGGADATTVAVVTDQAPPPPSNAEEQRMPVFARQFDLPSNVRSARLYAAGLGVYVAEVNGERVGETVLEPPNTDFADRVIYGTYDVTDLLRRGANVLGMRLGNGIYNVPSTPGRYQKLAESFGPPQLLAQLEVTLDNGQRVVVTSDESWRTTLGATTFSSWFGGEDYDARKVPDGWGIPDADLDDWESVAPATAPGEDTELSARFGPGIEPVDRIRAKSVTRAAPNVHVFDLGTNIAGWPELKVDLPEGTSVQLWPSEWLNADGRADQRTTGAPIWDTYTSAGRGPATWHPEFGYHGFRYVEVRGLPDDPTPELDTISGIVLRTANDEAGAFDSSNTLLNGIHRIIDRAVQSNMYSVLTDCPHREKLGWLEETHLVWETVSRGYDVSAYGRDLTRNMADAQTSDGLVPDIAPEYTVFSDGFRDDPNWGSAIIQVPWRMYQSYADTAILRPYYEDMKEYLEYLDGRSEGNLLDYGLGDWITFDNSTPVGVTASFGYHQAAQSMSRIAEVLGEDADATRFRQLTEDIGAAFHEKYYDEERGTYASGSQASDALALDMGIVPESARNRVLDHLLDSIIAAGDHFTVGEIALPSIIRVLHESGNDETMYRVATQTTNPSYGYQVVHGATSLTETWDGPTTGFSQNHFMLGAIDEWFSTALAGIGQQEGTVGYRDLEIAPSVVGDLLSAEAEYHTPYGLVSSSWQRHGHIFKLDVEVPVGSTARVLVPVFGDPDHPRYRPSGSGGARYLGIEDGNGVFEVGSGRWQFTARMQERAPAAQPFIAIDAPSEVALYDGEERDFSVTLRNLEDERATVEPTVDSDDGWTASAGEDRVSIPAGGAVTVQISVSADAADVPPGEVRFEVSGRRAAIPVSNTDNVARVATMTASSTYGHFSPAKTNDGDTTPMTDFNRWDTGNGWNDDTLSEFPDILTATWSSPKTVARVQLFTLDAAAFPASRYGVRDYDLEALVDGTWTTVASVRDNTDGVRESTFDPVTADALRLVVLDSNSHDFARVVELEAYR